jgi:DUF4097 and DUF4098 domain-containing protein YvlB
MIHRKGSAFLALFALFFGASLSRADDREFHWSGKLAANQVVEIKNVNGDIDANGVNGDQIEVTAVKSGEGAEQVNIEVVPSSEGVTICAVYPSSSWSFSRDGNRCEPGGSWHSSNNIKAKVEFTVHVPRNLRFTGMSVNGKVKAEGMGRFVKATSVNGSIEVSTASWAEATTVNGSIVARLGRTDWPDQLKFTTVNGSITLETPGDLNTNIDFTTVNGNFRSDLPLTMEGSLGRRHIQGRIGSGGRDLKVTTVNGSVELKRSTM